MASAKTVYSCQHCGAQSPKWMGKCLDCGSWNSFVEETYTDKPSRGGLPRGDLSHGETARTRSKVGSNRETAQPLSDIDASLGNHIPIGLPEFDRVLGGGYVPGSAVLIGGDPGIGKSTLLMQALGKLSHQGRKVLYVTGEESAAQIKARADRLQVDARNLLVLTENELQNIGRQIHQEKPDLVAIDSVQTLYSTLLESAPGTVSQVRECVGELIQICKREEISAFFVGHVTKEGAIAGPKVLEHMVDAVLYFESDSGHAFRILRSIKNRFGATNEMGVFEMTGGGLSEVANPSHLFLSERAEKSSGSVVGCSMEGTRPILLEIQSLVTHSGLANPRRTAIGIPQERLSLMVAVLEKVGGAHLGDQDIFVNIAGGMKTKETGLDLGIAIALYSSFRNAPVDPKTVLIGEVGLTGEVRAVQHIETRLKEASKLGFARVYIPKGNAKAKSQVDKIAILPVKNLEELIHSLF